MTGIRCFVAVELDDPARRELARVEDLLRRSGADVKWVDPGSLHLTLKFLGNVPPPAVTGVAAALANAARGQGPFAFSLAGVGAFPSLSRPRVVWVGVTEGRERLASLAASVEEALAPLGFAPEARGFSPHLTLGRSRSERGLAELRRAMEDAKGFVGPSVAVERMVLFSSDLRPSGPVYRPLGTFPLRDQA